MAFTRKHGSIEIQEQDGTEILTLTDIGDFTASNLQEGSAAAVRILNRGSFAGYVEGDDEEITGSLSARLSRQTFTDGAAARIMDILLNTGSVGSLTGANDNQISTGPMAFLMVYQLTDGTSTAAITFTEVRFTGSIDESGDTVNLTLNWTAGGYTGLT